MSDVNDLEDLFARAFTGVADVVDALERWAAVGVAAGTMLRSATFVVWDPAVAWDDGGMASDPSHLQLLLHAPTDFENPRQVEALAAFATTLRARSVIHVSRSTAGDRDRRSEEVTLAVEDLGRGVYLRIARVLRDSDGRELLGEFLTEYPFDFEIRLAPWGRRPPFPRLVR